MSLINLFGKRGANDAEKNGGSNVKTEDASSVQRHGDNEQEEVKVTKGGEMKTYTFTFKIKIRDYAKRFGIEIPDDSMDVELTAIDVPSEDEMFSNIEIHDGCRDSKTSQVSLVCHSPYPYKCRNHGNLRKAQDAIEVATNGVTIQNISDRIDSIFDDRLIDIRLTEGERDVLKGAAISFFMKYSKALIPLSTNGFMCFVPGEATVARHGENRVNAWAEYAVHAVTNDNIDPETGKHYRVYAPKKVELINPIISEIVGDDNVIIDDRKGKVVFVKKLDHGMAKVVAKPLERGNLWADLGDVTNIYSSKVSLPDNHVSLRKAAEARGAEGMLPLTPGAISDTQIIAQDEFQSQWWADSIAEDADVQYGTDMQTAANAASHNGCKTALQDCRAQNPMTCRYHGALAISNEIQGLIQKNGVNAQVTCVLKDVIGKYLEVEAKVIAPANSEAAVNSAMQQFMNMPGVSQIIVDSDGKGGEFYVDMLDPNAKAKWGGTGNASGQQQPQQPAQQAQTPVQQQPHPAPAPAAKPRPKRKITKPTSVQPQQEVPADNEKQEDEQKTDESQQQQPEEDTVSVEAPKVKKVSLQDHVLDAASDENAPELYPDQELKAPPDYTSPFTASELDSISKMAERIWKTVKQLDTEISQGTLASYLQRGNGNPGLPYANLPARLQKYKNEVDMAALQAFAAKDTDGQVKKLLDAANKINASEANGWNDAIGLTKADLTFDKSKYDDPYAKERADYDAAKKKSVQDSYKTALDSIKGIADRKEKDAPKDDAQKASELADIMDNIEGCLRSADMTCVRSIKRGLAKSYHKAKEMFDAAVEKCKTWIANQSYMKNSIAETIQGYKDRGEELPDQILGWQNKEDQLEDKAWRYIAGELGLNVADKAKCMANFKANMRKVAMESINYSSQSDDWLVKFIKGQGELHSTMCNYALASDECFGTKFGKKYGITRTHATKINDLTSLTKQQKEELMHQMHLYSITTSDESVRNNRGVIINNKKVVKGFFNENGASAHVLGVTGQKTQGSLNPTLMTDANCTGIVYYIPQGKRTKAAFKSLFEKDFTAKLTAGQIFDKLGCGKENETWIIGGLRSLDQVTEITLSAYSSFGRQSFTQDDIDRCRNAGVKVYKQTFTGTRDLLF